MGFDLGFGGRMGRPRAFGFSFGLVGWAEADGFWWDGLDLGFRGVSAEELGLVRKRR